MNQADATFHIGRSGFSMPFSRLDLRPQGEFNGCLRTPNGFEMWGFAQLDAYQAQLPRPSSRP